MECDRVGSVRKDIDGHLPAATVLSRRLRVSNECTPDTSSLCALRHNEHVHIGARMLRELFAIGMDRNQPHGRPIERRHERLRSSLAHEPAVCELRKEPAHRLGTARRNRLP